MTVQLLKTRVFEGIEYVAIERLGCSGCHFEQDNCTQVTRDCAGDAIRKPIIWIHPDKLPLMRLRGEL